MLKTIDLFAGAGGLSLGFQLTGKFKIVAAAEINKYARETYSANIAKNIPDFVFIENVRNYDFAALNKKLGGIDVVIGGPPCQGFSNANRQKNQIISMNNALVKEYFRAIKEIKPKAFVMENVSMLRSDKHRFYESEIDKDQMESLKSAGFNIPTREDTLIVADILFEGINYENLDIAEFQSVKLPEDLAHLLSILNKNINNPRRLPAYLEKNQKQIVLKIASFVNFERDQISTALKALFTRLDSVKNALQDGRLLEVSDDVKYIVLLQKAINIIEEIGNNRLLGHFEVVDKKLVFHVHSYSVIDYVNAILGDEYMQVGGTLNAEWFGVPQERRRYIVMGIRRDLCSDSSFTILQEPKQYEKISVGEAIMDLEDYDVSFDSSIGEMPYKNDDKNISPYAAKMRKGSSGVNNHVATKTTETALARFKVIKQGANFHSLEIDMKSTYSKPERTQNTIYLRLDPTKPSGTVVNVRKSMWIHPTLNRAITIREAARLQSFPDEFIFHGSKDSQYQQVGNAVPPLLAEAIAQHLLQAIK